MVFRKTAAAAAALAVTGAALTLGAGVALAEPPEGECPSDWIHVPIELIIPDDEDRIYDRNDNGFVCLKWYKDGPFDRTGKIIDDTIPDD
jgi:hypothetical protein